MNQNVLQYICIESIVMKMYLDCFKCKGKPYLRIVENFTTYENGVKKNKRKTIKNLGYLEKFDDGKPDFIPRMKEKLKNGELKIDGLDPYEFRARAKLYSNSLYSKSDYSYLNPRNIGYFFLESIYNNLGIYDLLREIKSNSKIEYDLNGLVKLFVFDRILDPSSKLKTFKNKDKYLFPITTCETDKDIYKPLDILSKYSKQIQLRMNTKIKNSSIGRKTDLTYYDVTNYYFETMYGDDDVYETDEDGNIVYNDETGEVIIKEKGLRKKGVSKENRKEPIVQMGLFIDNNGIPVSHNLYPGNMQDKNTFTDIIKNSINDSDLGRIVVVADNGMNTQENLYLLTEKNNGYIVAKSAKRCWKSYQGWIQNTSDYQEIKDAKGTVVFKYKSRIIERTLKYTDKETGKKYSKKVKEKEIVYWSKNHYERELHQNEKFIEYLESCKEHPDKLKDKQRKSQEFIKVIKTDPKTGDIIKTKDVVVLLEDKIQKYKETMGYYMIITSEINDDDKEIINKYHGLSRIEDSFRIIKSDLEGRPVFVWTPEHIKAHFLICFIALTIIRIIQYKVLKYQEKSTLNVDGWEQGITADTLKKELNIFQADQFDDNSFKITKPTETIEMLFKIFEIENFNSQLPNNKDLKSLRTEILKKKI